MESIGAHDLARMFELVANLCDLDERLSEGGNGAGEGRQDCRVKGRLPMGLEYT
jgi:hypothetical protein